MSDLNEELLERMQALWERRKFHIVAALLMLVSALAGLAYESLATSRLSKKAGEGFFALSKAAEQGDIEAATAALDDIDGDEFPEVRNLALLALAAAQAEQGDNAAAIETMREAVKSQTDPGLRRAARLRLGEMLINDGQYDSALEALYDPTAGGVAKILLAERSGDAHYAAGRLSEAREAYEEAREDALRFFPAHLPVLNIKLGAVNSLLPELAAILTAMIPKAKTPKPTAIWKPTAIKSKPPPCPVIPAKTKFASPHNLLWREIDGR